MGFSSGLPLLLIGSTLSVWFTEEKVDLTVIGLFSLIGIPYVFKFMWAPFLDRYVPPLLGRRRGWLLITQVCLIVAIFALSLTDPSHATLGVACLALVIAFLSATQDIALDAYRREILSVHEFGLGNSLAITGYRLAMIFSGAMALWLADHMSWHAVYMIMACGMLVGVVTTLLAPEPIVEARAPQSLQEAFVEPFTEFLKRRGAILILLFLVFYKLADVMATQMTMPFYRMIGFEKTQIASIVKLFGIWATIGGGMLGGALMIRLGLYRSLWVFGILQAIANLGFSFLARIGPHPSALMAVITMENLTAGMGAAAFATFMASITNKKFTATQYALLSGLTRVPGVIFASPTGWMAKVLGWEAFFITCTAFALPGMILLFVIHRLGVFNFADD